MIYYPVKKAIGFLLVCDLLACGHRERQNTPATAPPVSNSIYGNGKASLLLGGTPVGPITLDSACPTHFADNAVYFIYRHRDRKLAANWNFGRTGGRMLTPKPTYYTLSVPRNARLQLRLPDGTTVWLNAESSLFFPVPFTTNERYLELRGEAFFTVDTATKTPFRVCLDNPSGARPVVRLSGPRCNVRAYPDAPYSVITPLDGTALISIRHGNLTKKAVCKGMQQIVVDNNGNPQAVTQAVSTDGITSWTTGVFSFRNAPIEDIADRLRRWYDAEISVTEKITPGFTCTIPMNKTLAETLGILEKTGAAHFKTGGKKVVVTK